MPRRQIDMQRDHALLIKKLGIGRTECLNLDESDLAVLREGTHVFLWESPLASSLEEVTALARQAAADMTPTPDRIILAAVLYVLTDDTYGLASIQAISDAVQPVLSQAVTIILGAGFCKEKGIRFLLSTSEGERR